MHLIQLFGLWRTLMIARRSSKSSSLTSVALATEPATAVTRLLCIAVLVALCLVLTPPGVAFAAGEDIWDAVAITAYDLGEGQEPTLVISSLVREGTELPVDAVLAIPRGAEVSWVGEILGGDPAADPRLEAIVDAGAEYDVVMFTLTRSHQAQIEMTMPQDWIVSTEVGRRISLEWTSAGLVDRARIGITLPLTYHLEDASPPARAKIQPSDILYSVETSPVAMGQTIALSGVIVDGMAPELTEMMTRGGEGSAGSAEGTGSVEIQPIRASNRTSEDEGIDTAWIIAIALGAIVAVLVVVAVSRSRRAP